MIKSTVVSLAFIAISFFSFSQKESENILKYIQACETCNEVIMISAGLEKNIPELGLKMLKLKTATLFLQKGL